MDGPDEQAVEAFRGRFSAAPEIAVQAPGRVNLIGGHLDYHQGFVLPLAIDRRLTLLGRRRTDRQVRVHSERLGLSAWLDLETSARHPTVLGRYCQGVIMALRAVYPLERGCEVLIAGDLPPGAGLSSSSALVLGFARLLAEANGHSPPPLTLAQIGAQAEFWFGTTGGLMDQYVITHAQTDHALLIDCRSLTHRVIPVPATASVVVAHTGTPHHQIASPFAIRRREAEAGLGVLQKAVPSVRTLRDVSLEYLIEHHADLIELDPSGAVWRRCRHVVTEMARVQHAATALEAADLEKVGALMRLAHVSLRDDYEVSSAELDAMFETAVGLPGWFGGRMTGGGFGGSTVNLVASDAAASFCSELAERYERRTRIRPTIFQTSACAGLSAAHLGS